MSEDQGKLETWAIVEVMGHSRFAGFVQQVPMGGAAMIRVDVPAIPESEEERPHYDDEGKRSTIKVKVAGTPAFTKFLGVSSIFAITPCDEEAAREAVRQFRSAPVTILSLSPRRQLADQRDDDEYRNV